MKKFVWGGVIALLSANLLTAEIFIKEEVVGIPTVVFKARSDDWPDSDGWKSAFFGNEITVGNQFANGFDVYASVLTGMDGFGTKNIYYIGEGEAVQSHLKSKQTFLDNALGVGYTIYGLRVGVDLFHAMDLGASTSSRLYLAPQLHYGYSFGNIPLTLGVGAEWDFGIGFQGARGRGRAGNILGEQETKAESNPQFWLDASYKASEKVSFGLFVGADINESPKTRGFRYTDTNSPNKTPEEVAKMTQTERQAYMEKVTVTGSTEYKHVSLSFPIKLGVTFR